jgi:hypothetical protein
MQGVIGRASVVAVVAPMFHPQNLLSHQRFSSRMALLCLKLAAI